MKNQDTAKPKTSKRAPKAEPKVEDKAPEGEEEPEEQSVGQKMSNTLRKYRVGYEPTVAYSGRVSACTGDDLAHILGGLSPQQVIALAEKLCGFQTGELAQKYERLNPGQQRMNSGNRIRSLLKRGDKTLDDVKVALKH